jgi:hypothetical protein
MRAKNGMASRQVWTTSRMFFFAALVSCSVLFSSLLLQWLIYDDWLHQTGALRIVGSGVAALVTFFAMFRWQSGLRKRQMETFQRFATIASMNDRIRNSLQAIECITYASNPKATESVKKAVDVIDGVLREVVAELNPGPIEISPPKASAPSTPLAQRKSA